MDINSDYYAHIAEDGRKQTVKEHLENTAELASKFAKQFGMENEAYVTGLLHDIGKYTAGFQKRLLGGPRVDHSSAGAYEALKKKMVAEAFCIAGHHAGLPNGGSRTQMEGASLLARINRVRKDGLESYSAWENEITIPFIGENILATNDWIKSSFQIRMLYSCLVDADYLDTEHFMQGDKELNSLPSMDILEVKLNKYISNWFPAKNELNKLRCDILSHVMKEGQCLPRGLYTLTVPTGGGKTVASLAFAIEHAKAKGLDRIIYVIPYTSIIEQTAEVFRAILGDDNVLEHHSNAEQPGDDDTLYCFKATENWDIPIVVTTSVQFFESFFKNKPSSSRKLHNVANSVIIFDEAQMLPLPYIKPCVALMTNLVEQFNASVVLCTATQPALIELIRDYYPAYIPYELCPKEYYISPMFSRVRYIYEKKYSFEKLAERINKESQCLCIVNSKNAAQKIYELMNGEGCFHLSTNMYPLHRKQILNTIRERLMQGLPCRVVSTSLIEAGVDVDFPTVYRQISGLDSILQAGGRCNREGKRSRYESIVHIFDLECGSPLLFSPQIGAAQYVIDTLDNFTNDEAITLYFKQLFYLKGEEALDQHNIIKQLKENNYPFSDVSDQFNLIESNTRSIYIDIDGSRELIERVRLGFAGKRERRELSLYSVNIYDHQYKALKTNHAIEELESGECILIDSSRYNSETGLVCAAETGEAIMI